MTKTQTIAQAMLIALGILSTSRLLNITVSGARLEASGWWGHLCLFLYGALIVLVIQRLILGSHALAQKLAPAQNDDLPACDVYYGAVLRVTFMLCGLLLLKHTYTYLGSTAYYLASPTGFRELIQSCITIGWITTLREALTATTTHHLLMTLEAFVAAYLLCGAPHWIKWQLKRGEQS